MKDLQCLAPEHHIESKLYSGDGLEHIYQLLGDNQVTIWLSKLCEETSDDHEQWMKLIESATTKDAKSNTKQNSDGRQIVKNGAHFTNQNAEKKWYFFDETDDHIAAAGPRGTEIIQYFTSKKFVEMTPKERFKSSEEKDIVFNVYSLEHHRAQANTVMGNAREISFAKMYHMTNIQ